MAWLPMGMLLGRGGRRGQVLEQVRLRSQQHLSVFPGRRQVLKVSFREAGRFGGHHGTRAGVAVGLAEVWSGGVFGTYCWSLSVQSGSVSRSQKPQETTVQGTPKGRACKCCPGQWLLEGGDP